MSIIPSQHTKTKGTITMTRNLSHLLLGVILCLCMLHIQNTSAQEAAPTVDTGIPDIILVPVAEVSVEKQQKAVLAAAPVRQWIPQVTSDNCVRCDLTVRGKHRVIIDVLLDPKKITFRYVSSENMNYDPVKKKIHRKYEPWVNLLKAEINKQIGQLSTTP